MIFVTYSSEKVIDLKPQKGHFRGKASMFSLLKYELKFNQLLHLIRYQINQIKRKKYSIDELNVFNILN